MSIARLIDRTIEGILKDAQFAYDYIIYTDGTNVFAFNTKTKSIDFVGTDASVVIQSAINALSNGGTIFVKTGTYGLSSKVTLMSNIGLIGEGMNTIFEELAQGAIFYGMNVQNVRLENFFFNCNGFSALGAGYAYACAIGFDSDGTVPLYNIVLRNIKTYNGIGAHIHFWGSDNTLENVYRNVLLENVECSTNPQTTASNPMLLLDYVNGATLINCYAHDVANNADSCIALDGKNIVAINCRGERGLEGLRIEYGPRAGGNVRIIGGYFAYNTNGISLYPNTEDVLISGVKCYRNANAGISLYSTGNQNRIKIVNCYISESGYPNTQGLGITINGTSVGDVLIEGCIIRNIGFTTAENSGIQIVMGNNVKIRANTIIDDRTTQYTKWGIEFRQNAITNVICKENAIFGVTSATIALTYGASVTGFIKTNIGYDTDNFKVTGLSVPVGVSGAYGSAVSITSLSGIITYPRVKITWGGTFGTGETVTVQITAVYSDGTTASITKSATAVGSLWLTDDDVFALITQGKDITQLQVSASSNLASTSVTVTVNAYGKG